MVLPPSADGRVRHTKTLDEKLVPRSSLGVHPGKKMRITDGRHSGMFCQVVELLKVQKGRSGSNFSTPLPFLQSMSKLFMHDFVVVFRNSLPLKPIHC